VSTIGEPYVPEQFAIPGQPAAPVPEPAPTATLPKVGAHAAAPTTPHISVLPTEVSADAYRRATTEQSDENDLAINELLVAMMDTGASDLHLTSGARPTIRVRGELAPLDETLPVLTPPVLQRSLYAMMSQKQRERFETELELDFAYSVPGRARFRVNVYRQREALGAAFRLIPYEIKPLEALGIPPAVNNFAGLPRGMVLVTGPTGSGAGAAGCPGIANCSGTYGSPMVLTTLPSAADARTPATVLPEGYRPQRPAS
jgi:twitching motility protein PilT